MESQERVTVSPQSSEAASSQSLRAEVTPHSGSAETQEGFLKTFISMFSSTLGLPLGFFQSRPEIRTWGEAVLQDPSVQPTDIGAPKNYGTGLPGYPKESCAYLARSAGPNKEPVEFVKLFSNLDVSDNKLIGPRLTGFRKCKAGYSHFAADKIRTPIYDYRDILGNKVDYCSNAGPPRQFGSPTYDYRDLLAYRMDYHPYVNAVMNPKDPAHMYVTANWVAGYPYGVPAVEENEKAGWSYL